MSLFSNTQSYFHTPETTTANDMACVSRKPCLIKLHAYVYKNVHTHFSTYKQIMLDYAPSLESSKCLVLN